MNLWVANFQSSCNRNLKQTATVLLSGAIADEQLMLQQQGLCGDGADATGADQLREGDRQVDAEYEEFAHEANRTMITSVRRLRRTAAFPLAMNSPPTGGTALGWTLCAWGGGPDLAIAATMTS